VRGVWTVAQVRAAESALMATLPDGVLMQRAAAGLARQCHALLERTYGARLALLVGSGSNGGDALFAGARLARRGARVTAVVLKPERAHAAGLAALSAAGGRRVDASDGAPAVQAADLVVDGILGIGGKGDLGGAAADLAAVAADHLTVAVDLPSGVDADTGWVGAHAIRADVTVTFGALKPGLVSGPGADRSGEVRLVDIGLDATLPEPSVHVLEEADVAAALPEPTAADDKYTRGVVGVVAGSAQYPGAGVLATGSALHGGAGMVRYLGLAQEVVRARYPEVVAQPESRPHEVRVQSWTVGPGLGTDDAAMALLSDVLRTDVPVIVDADAITLVARSPGLVRNRSAPTVLTPHDREFARLAGDPTADRIASARRAAADLGATVLLKGNATIVAEPGGRAFVNPTGTPWLGTAGSGDVLSGLIGSLLATGLEPGRAAAVGAYVHGVAGQLAAADGPPTATDVLAALRPTLRRIAERAAR
jgi:ADP-dependent NAD(P)H-hydrate dehydratase / NAD(P)H-hydrate epimerase